MKLAALQTSRPGTTGFARLALFSSVVWLLSDGAAPVPAYGAPIDRMELTGALRGKKAALPPRGIVIYKRHIQADEHAPCVEYSSLNVVAKTAIDLIKHNGGGLVSIPKHQLVHHITYPQETAELASDQHVDKLRQRLTKLREVAERYHQAASRLHPWIARLQHEVTMWDDGFCRIDGRWVNRYEQQVAELRSAFAQRRSNILNAPVAAQPVPQQPNENELPPLWALDFEQQLKDEEAALLEAQKKQEADARVQRSEQFHEQVEDQRPFRTDWKIKG